MRNALKRGHLMGIIARGQRRGIPVDVANYKLFCKARPYVIARIVKDLGSPFCNEKGSIIDAALADLIERNHITDWPKTPKGKLSKKLKHFKDRAAAYAEFVALVELKAFVDKLKKLTLEIGADGRCRFEWRPLKTITGRFAPKGSPYAASKWTRVFIKPEPGKVLIEFDWVAQEAGIFAVYSQDPAMLEAYEDDDFPLAVARMCGGITSDTDPGEIKVIRDRYKVVFYANTYGGGAKKLAEGLKITPAEAALIQRRINTTFRVGRGWLMRTRDCAFQRGKIKTHLGSWALNIPAGTKVTSIQNWKIQAGGSELLRETLPLIDAAGVKILCPIHDAILVEADAADAEAVNATVIECMNQAAAKVLDGYVLKVKPKELKGEANDTWRRIQGIIDELGEIPDPPPKKKRRPVARGDGKTIHRTTKKALATVTKRIEDADDVNALPQFFGAVRLTQAFLNNGSLSPEAAETAIAQMREAAIGAGAEPKDIPGTERHARDTDERAGPPEPRGCASAIQSVLDQVHDAASLYACVDQMRGFVRNGVLSKRLAANLLKKAAIAAGVSHA